MTGINDLSTVFGALGGPAKAETGPVVLKSSDSAASKGLSAATGADSSAVSTVAGALSQAVSTSDVRSDKVEQLKAAIASGTYNVSSSAMADKLIQSMLGEK